MRNYTIILFLLLSFTGFSQVDPNLLFLKNRKIENPLGEPKSNPKQTTLADALIDTNGYSIQPMRMTTKGNKVKKEELNVIDDVVLAVGDGVSEGIDFLNSYFEKEQKKTKVQHNAFYITVDTTINLEFEKKMAEARKREDAKFKDNLKNIVNESSKGFNDVLVIENPVKIEEPKMTVMFKNGKLCPIEKDSIAEVGKKVVEKVFKMDVDDALDIEWKKTKTFTFQGETYTKMSKEELEELEKTTVKRVRKVKKKEPVDLNNALVNKGKFIYSSKGTESAQAFIDEYEDEARALEVYGIPWEITISMAILESRHGESYLTRHSNNIFSIKDSGGRCKNPNHRHFKVTDDAYMETFHVYNSFGEAFIAFKDFLKRNDRYKPCFTCKNDISCWLRAIDKSGYATDPNYGRMLLEIINKYNLAGKRIYYKK